MWIPARTDLTPILTPILTPRGAAFLLTLPACSQPVLA